MSDLETKILTDAMRMYFLHRDFAVACQREFTMAQKAFVKEMIDRGHTRDDIRAATADFTRTSHRHRLLVDSVKEAAHALQVANAWYVRQQAISMQPVFPMESDPGRGVPQPPLFPFRENNQALAARSPEEL